MANASALPGYLSLTHIHDAANNTANNYGFISIVSTIAWGLGYFGMPHILLRFMAIEDERKLTLSRRVASIWVVISMAVAVFIGIVGYSMTKNGALEVLEGSNSETLIIKTAQLLSQHSTIAVLLAGVILAGILASTMSTADSQLLVCASSASKDIFKNILKPEAEDKKVLNVSRITVLVIAVVACIIAWNPDSSIMGLVSDAWAGLGSAFGPLVVCSLFWKRTNLPGAVAGIVSGGLFVIIWDYLPILGGQTPYTVTGIYSLLLGFFVSLLCIVIVSLLTKAPSKEIVEEFESVKTYQE